MSYSNYGKKIKISIKNNKIYYYLMKIQLKVISEIKGILTNDLGVRIQNNKDKNCYSPVYTWVQDITRMNIK